MSIDLKALNYVPTLSIRPADMRGLEELPPEVKDRIQPIFLFAPWPNAKTIERTTERLNQAFGQRPFFLDIDKYYNSSPQLSSEIKAFLKNIQSADDGYRHWITFIKNLRNASPCLQFSENTTEKNLITQIRAFQALERSFAVRFELTDRFRLNLQTISLIIHTLREIGTADYAIIIDGGWTKDSQSMQGVIQNFIGSHLSDLNPAIPIIVSYTTTPKDYTKIIGVQKIEFDNRKIIAEIRRNVNKASIIYGDWGSTKPRDYTRAQQPAPRIDVALKNSWLIARNTEEEWTYQNAAGRIIHNREWDKIKNIHLWGIQCVNKTAEISNSAIHSPQSNVAARINMHLYMQAYAEENYPQFNIEEDWEDIG